MAPSPGGASLSSVVTALATEAVLLQTPTVVLVSTRMCLIRLIIPHTPGEYKEEHH